MADFDDQADFMATLTRRLDAALRARAALLLLTPSAPWCGSAAIFSRPLMAAFGAAAV
jgi:hypothetical protein